MWLLKLPLDTSAFSLLFTAAAMLCCNKNTGGDPSNLLQKEPYHIISVIFVSLKQWVSEEKDLHNDKTNTQCRHLTKLLPINNSDADYEH